MENLLAYDSSSDSEESDQTTRQGENNKKRKVTELEQGNNVYGARNITQVEDKRLKPFLEPSNAAGMRNNVSESKKSATETYKVSRYDGSGLSNDFRESHSLPKLASGSRDTGKTLALNSSVTQCKRPHSSISGTSVKPYISKREREKFAPPTTTSHVLTFPVKPQLEVANVNQTLKEVISESSNETAGRKNPDRVCRPPKQLHLNLEGHSKGVNCVNWNPTRSNLLLSAAMDHVVCIWDTSGIGTCSRRLTRHTAAVKDSKWSFCGTQVLSCGYDKTARLFDLETGNILP